MRTPRRDRRDRDGHKLKPGDRVPVVSVPDLSGMAKRPRAETGRAFRHLVGTYKRIDSFDDLGLAWLTFRIRNGPLKGRHWVGIEPHLLRRVVG